MYMGGNNPPPSTNITETWNGTSWTEVAELGTASRYMAGGTNGTSSSALCTGGSSTGPSQNETTNQEWSADAAVVTITTS